MSLPTKRRAPIRYFLGAFRVKQCPASHQASYLRYERSRFRAGPRKGRIHDGPDYVRAPPRVFARGRMRLCQPCQRSTGCAGDKSERCWNQNMSQADLETLNRQRVPSDSSTAPERDRVAKLAANKRTSIRRCCLFTGRCERTSLPSRTPECGPQFQLGAWCRNKNMPVGTRRLLTGDKTAPQITVSRMPEFHRQKAPPGLPRHQCSTASRTFFATSNASSGNNSEKRPSTRCSALGSDLSSEILAHALRTASNS
jgi:hypothetical protein